MAYFYYGHTKLYPNRVCFENEMWLMVEKDDKAETIHVRYHRFLLGVTLRRKQPNEDIRKKMKTAHAVDYIKIIC